MMKLVSCLSLASVASAATAADPFLQKSSPIVATAAGSSNNRILEDEGEDNGGGGNYDISGYSLMFNRCIKTKIAQDTDDDGCALFYNGACRSQYKSHVSYRLCTDGGNGQCVCDSSVDYVSELDNFLEMSINYIGGGNGDDAMNYLQCAQGGADDNGNVLYYGPQCTDTGGLIVGGYYDDECTIKASYTPNLSYSTFTTIQSTCQSCANGNCNEVYEDSNQCSGGKDISGRDDEDGVCNAAKRANTVMDYSGVKKRHAGAILIAKVFIGMLIIGLVGGFMFLTYTYYIRHRGDRTEHLVDPVGVGAALT